MPAPRGMQDLLAGELLRQLQALAAGTAAGLGAPADHETLSEDDELFLWDYADPKVDAAALEAQGMHPNEISRKVHPHRDRLVEGGGRVTWEQQIDYAERMARRSDERTAEQLNQLKASGPLPDFTEHLGEPSEQVPEPLRPDLARSPVGPMLGLTPPEGGTMGAEEPDVGH